MGCTRLGLPVWLLLLLLARSSADLPPALDPSSSLIHPKGDSELERKSPFHKPDLSGLSFSKVLIWFDNFACGQSCRLRSKKCATCYCDAHCLTYGDCCPQYHLQNATDFFPPYPCYPVLEGAIYLQLVATCPPDQDWTETGRKCRTLTLASHHALPVSDMEKNVTYLNRFCAQCNNVTKYQPWSVSITCTNGGFSSVAEASTLRELISLVSEDQTLCKLDLLPPGGTFTRKCTPRPSTVMSSCNMTGKWRIFDENIVRACAAYSNFYEESGNVFCGLCNDNNGWLAYKFEDSPVIGLPQTAVLNVQEDEVQTGDQSSQVSDATVSCSSAHTLDPASNQCRPLTCASGKALRKGECVNIISKSDVFIYQVSFFAAVTTDTAGLENVARYSTELAWSLIAYIKLTYFRLRSLSFHTASVACSNGTVTAVVSACSVVDLATEKNLDIVEYDLLALFNGSRSISDRHFRQISLSLSMLQSDADKEEARCDLNDTAKNIKNMSYKEDFVPSEKTRFEGLYTKQLSPLMLCPQVTLEADEFVYSSSSNTLVVKATHASVSHPYFTVENGLAKLCVNTYLTGFECYSSEEECTHLLLQPQEEASVPSIAGTLSFSCTVVSLFFLALTLVAYVVFEEMRTLAGVCSICMVCVLFLAQAVFEFGAEQTEIPGVCVALGAVVHFLWLSATFWMNACTVLMFFRLMFPLKALTELHSRAKVLAISTVHSFLCPAVIVGAVMGASVSLHGDLGYGGSICYIKRAAVRRFGLALPVGCLVLVNLGLFLATIIKLRRTSISSSAMTNKVGMLACAKLSVITGMSWLSLFVYEVFRFEAVQYMAIVLFGLHGVVIFWAFAFHQVRNHCGSQWMKWSSSSSSASTRAAHASTPLALNVAVP